MLKKAPQLRSHHPLHEAMQWVPAVSLRRTEKRTSQSPRSLRPRLGQGASRRAGVGWVRMLAFLSILKPVRVRPETGARSTFELFRGVAS